MVHLLGLPLEMLREILAATVLQQPLKKSLCARLTCRLFADEIISGIITSGAIGQVAKSHVKQINLAHRQDLLARYLLHRVHVDPRDTHPWITAIRLTCNRLAQHKDAHPDAECVLQWEKRACMCFALNHGLFIFSELIGDDTDTTKVQFIDTVGDNCLALAAWCGDLALVKSLYCNSDPMSFFGRPSWAAAANGRLDVLKFFIDGGALPYEPTYQVYGRFQLGTCPLGAAAYQGHEDIVRFYLEQPHYHGDLELDFQLSVQYAAQGNQSRTLELLLRHEREYGQSADYQELIDLCLTQASELGAGDAVQYLLASGADPNASDQAPCSCLQLAARARSAPVVKMLLQAGASFEPAEFRWDWDSLSRTMRRMKVSKWRRPPDAISLATELGYTEIVEILQEWRSGQINEG